MLNLKTYNFCDLFEFNSRRNPVGRLHLKIDSTIYPPEFEFTAGTRYGTFEISNHLDDLALTYKEADILVLHMFVPDGLIGNSLANHTPEKNLYRYGTFKHLKDAREKGHFLIFPAIEYIKKEYDAARQDNELAHRESVTPERVTITTKNNVRIIPVGDVTFSTLHLPIDSYILCFSYDYDEGLYEEFKGSDACLIIDDVEEFADRLHAAFTKAVPSHCGVNARVSYSKHQNSLGVLFSKPKKYLYQREHRFLWVPENPIHMLEPVAFIKESPENIRTIIPAPVEIYAGPLDDITEVVDKFVEIS
jgi:hypothetical protein